MREVIYSVYIQGVARKTNKLAFTILPGERFVTVKEGDYVKYRNIEMQRKNSTLAIIYIIAA